MKKVVLIAVMTLIMFSHVYAQFTIGPKAGLNISKEVAKIYGSDFSDYKTGINVGIFGKYSICKSFDVQAELMYSQQGYKSDVILMDIGGYQVQNLNKRTDYLNIPLLLRYNLLGRPWIFIEAGPQLGFCMGEHHSFKDDKEIEDALNKHSTYNTVDFSLVGGIGFYLGKGISINARYNHGLTNSDKYDLDLKNRVFQFSLAYNLLQF